MKGRKDARTVSGKSFVNNARYKNGENYGRRYDEEQNPDNNEQKTDLGGHGRPVDAKRNTTYRHRTVIFSRWKGELLGGEGPGAGSYHGNRWSWKNQTQRSFIHEHRGTRSSYT